MTINRRHALGIVAAAASSTLFSPVYAQSLNKRKIAFTLLVPPGGDVGWDYEHVRGLEQAREIYGERAQIDAFHGIPQWGNGEKEKIQELIDDGYEMIFTTSSGYMGATVELAQKHPEVTFENCAGYIRAKNLATYNTRWYEGRAVEGFLAATMSKTNRIGYLGAFATPQVVRGINAAYLAAKTVNPDIEFDIVWLNTWFNPASEKEVALQLVDRGADVLMQHTGSTAAVEVAQDKGVYSFGQASDMSGYGPDAVMTSMVNNWGPYYVRRIGEFLDDTWETQDTWGGLGDDMVTMSPLLESLPSRTVLQVRDVIQRISSGDEHAYVGPVRKQDGSGWLASGETATDSNLLTMNYYVEGISSVYPTKG